MQSKLFIRHDIYTLDDTKIEELVYKYHEAGYGVWWAVVERLTLEDSHMLNLDTLVMKISIKLNVSKPSRIAEIIRYCIEIGLLQTDDEGNVYNERVRFQCEQVAEYSKKQSENVRKRWQKQLEEQAEGQTAEQNEPEEAQSDSLPNAVWKDVLQMYRDLCPSLQHVRSMPDARKVHARTLAEMYSMAEIEEGFRKAEASDFLKNGLDTWSGANFDWLINKNNFAKVLEGKYDNKTAVRRSSICESAQAMTESGDGNGGFTL